MIHNLFWKWGYLTIEYHRTIKLVSLSELILFNLRSLFSWDAFISSGFQSQFNSVNPLLLNSCFKLILFQILLVMLLDWNKIAGDWTFQRWLNSKKLSTIILNKQILEQAVGSPEHFTISSCGSFAKFLPSFSDACALVLSWFLLKC